MPAHRSVRPFVEQLDDSPAERAWKVSDPRFESDELRPELAVSPWAGHRGFAYDLIRYLQPACVIELGVHWGCSFFAFCQAVKDEGLATRLMGVDTWAGDEHAGEYGDEVFDFFQRVARERFGDLAIAAHRKLASEALDGIPDDSADVIHIDGCHHYEAVDEDFRTWLPKLRPGGVMLFHDVADASGYGSAHWWHNIRGQHAGFAFPHSWGLGVLFPKGDELLCELMDRSNFADKLLLYPARAELQRARIELQDVTAMALERFDALQKQSKMVAERDARIESQYGMIAQRDAWAADLQGKLDAAEELAVQRLEAIDSQSRRIDELSGACDAAEQLARERLEAIEGQSRTIDERARWIEDLERRLGLADSMTAELATRAETAERLARERLESIDGQSAMIAERDRSIADLERMALERYEAIASQTRLVDERDATIRELEKLLREREAMMQELNQHVAELRQRTDANADELKSITQRLTQMESTFQRHQGMLERLQAWKRMASRVVFPFRRHTDDANQP